MGNNRQVEDMAASWLLKRDSGEWSEADQAQFAEWWQASTANRVSFLRLESAWEDMNRLKALGAGFPPRTVPAADELMSLPGWARQGPSPSKIEEPAEAARDTGSRPGALAWRRVAAAAAAVVVATALLFYMSGAITGDRYSTPIGVVTSVPLKDGSSMMLNTASAVRVRLTSEERRVDLALIEVDTGRVRRLVERQAIRGFRVDPRGGRIAYTVPTRWVLNTKQTLYDIAVVDLSSMQVRTLVSDAILQYGHELSWSADGRRIAYVSEDRDGVSMQAPFWSPDGRQVYGLAAGALWQFDPSTGRAQAIFDAADQRLLNLASAEGSQVAWDAGGGEILALARDADTGESLVVRITPADGSSRTILRAEARSIQARNIDISTNGEPAYVAQGRLRPPDLWLLDVRHGRERRLTRSNELLDRYALGDVRRIRWTSARGEDLEGLLLLPPGWKAGQRLPTVVEVYGGRRVGSLLHRYGLGSGNNPAANPYVLTTRGYAVFHPDAPVRTGEIISDLMAAVMPGVDAIVDAGYADPQRLAIMGGSYGAYSVWSIISHTTRFKAAITTANVIDADLFAAYFQLGPGFFEGSHQGNMGGDPWTHRERHLRNSPFFFLDRVRTPLLIVQGSDDGKLIAPETMFLAMQRLGQIAEYRLYAGEGHSLHFRANVMDFWRSCLRFLQEHLGKS